MVNGVGSKLALATNVTGKVKEKQMRVLKLLKLKKQLCQQAKAAFKAPAIA